MKTIFIAGTDTGVGKSMVSGLLARHLSEAGYKIATQKWVQTGWAPGRHDIDTHLRLMGKDGREFRDYLPLMKPYVFSHGLSPHLASGLEKKSISAEKIKRCTSSLAKHFDLVIIEGTGGLLVPISRKGLLIDIAREMDLPVLLVVGNRLGCINHALLSIEALKRRKMHIAGMIFNNVSKSGEGLMLRDNPRVVEKLTGVTLFGSLPYSRGPEPLFDKFAPVGEKIRKCLWKT